MVTALVSRSFVGAAWRAYERQLEQRPLLTQVATSGVLWGAGDMIAQRMGGGRRAWNTRRTALTATFGAGVIAPLGSLWYGGLDRLASIAGSQGTLPFLLAKVAADASIWTTFYMAAFFLWGELVIDRGSVQSFVKRMKAEFGPTLAAETAVCPPLMLAVFSKLPVSYHLLAVNIISVFDVAFLSAMRSGALMQILSSAAAALNGSNRQQQKGLKQEGGPELPSSSVRHAPEHLQPFANSGTGPTPRDEGSDGGSVQQTAHKSRGKQQQQAQGQSRLHPRIFISALHAGRHGAGCSHYQGRRHQQQRQQRLHSLVRSIGRAVGAR